MWLNTLGCILINFCKIISFQSFELVHQLFNCFLPFTRIQLEHDNHDFTINFTQHFIIHHTMHEIIGSCSSPNHAHRPEFARWKEQSDPNHRCLPVIGWNHSPIFSQSLKPDILLAGILPNDCASMLSSYRELPCKPPSP